jgi:D-glycero-D-manno-heptose 1,7-bisphosphate phosphatase
VSLVILDRDGVINEDSDDFIKSPDEFVVIPGSLEAIARLNHAGHRVIVASNQSGIGRKLFDIETLMRIHERLYRQLAEVGGSIEAIFFCPHVPRDRCKCRKPQPGMFNDIARRLRRPLDDVPVVGDKLSDVEAARQVGARPVLVRTGKGRVTETESAAALAGVPVYDDLAAVVDDLLQTREAG